MTAWRITLLGLAAALPSLGTAQPIASCDALRAQIETKVRASGVTQFIVTAADVDAVVPGRVVGTCDRGHKKLVYLQLQGSSPAPPAKRPDTPVLTECADGSVKMGGDCKKQTDRP